MYCELQQVDLKITKHIYLSLFEDDNCLITIISTQFYSDNYYFNYFIDTKRDQKVFDYLIHKNIAKICYLLKNEEVFTSSEQTIAYKMQLTTKALLNVL
jgi:hypothetical protein